MMKISDDDDLPTGYYAAEATHTLVKTWQKGSSAERYEKGRELIRRASEKGEVDFLIKMLESKKMEAKVECKFFIGEISDKTGTVWPTLRKFILEWASDLVAQYRYSFVSFVWNSKLIDREIVEGIEKCLNDSSSFVRHSAIDYLICLNDDKYNYFHSLLLNIDPGDIDYKIYPFSDHRNRKHRALNIAYFIRHGKSLEYIESYIKFEDSDTYDYFKLDHVLKRILRRRNSNLKRNTS